VRPVVRHFLDSHLNGYIRTNLALTEETTTSKTYDEARWAEMADGHGRNAETSMVLLETLHRQWTARFESLAPADFAHPLRHPEVGDVTVDDVVSLHAWHGRHDVVLITALQEFED
jgi:hypothetical protein